jgi:hypothetical protein
MKGAAVNKPLALIDVDGVLNPITRQVPPGYTHYDIKVMSPIGRGRTFPVRLNPDHGRMFGELAEKFELVWATTWEDDANTLIGPKIGMPELPVIHLNDYDEYGHYLLPPVKWSNQTWMAKCPAVLKYVADRPFVWFDDTFTQHDFDWASRRNGLPLPTKLIAVFEEEGLKEDHIIEAVTWADHLAAGRTGKQEPTDAN